jgi:Lon protease-like protein
MRLPYFPLHVVLFPHLPLPLHIFEERYRAMTRDLLADGSPYAGRFVISGGGDEDAPEGSVGTVAEVRRAEQFADGRWWWSAPSALRWVRWIGPGPMR